MAFQPPRGTRDFLPEEMELKEFILTTIKRVYRSFGFVPLETPAFESWELLSAKGAGGEELKKEIYHFKDKSDRELGLRFDLTVPLARVIANNPQLPKPFKRYQIGRTWRYDRPQAGRYREFWQADADIIGSPYMTADAECICAAQTCLEALGFKDFVIRLNNRKILNGLIEYAGIDEKKAAQVLITLDKLEKIGEREVITELHVIGIDSARITKLMKLVKLKSAPGEKLERERVPTLSVLEEGLQELEEILENARAYGFAKRVVIDFSLVRGLDYYTGPIFEFSVGAGIVGSVGGGGRYDNLIGLYGAQTPATGVSLGIDRIGELMKQWKKKKPVEKKVFVGTVSDSKNVTNYALKTATALRNEDIIVETDVMGRKLRRNLEYASAKNTNYAVIIGEKELASKKLAVKDMKQIQQKTMSLHQLLKMLKK